MNRTHPSSNSTQTKGAEIQKKKTQFFIYYFKYGNLSKNSIN